MKKRGRAKKQFRGMGAACLFCWVLLGLCGVAIACDCGFEDGQYTLNEPIVIDGSVGDWANVLADPDNNACDGGDDAGLPIDPQPDLDWPIQSTGRDLVHFAMTWDDTYIYTYTERIASATNVQRFVYYTDENNDRFLQEGENVIVVEWKGSNRRVDFYIGSYEPYAGAGGAPDPLVDPSTDKADGYMVLGHLKKKSLTYYGSYSGNFGAASGLVMEWKVAWADLGMSPNTPFTFHISTTNSQPGSASFPDQVDDNMGGCGGGAGTTQYPGLTYSPDLTVYGVPGMTCYGNHTITNLSNGADTFNLATTHASDFTPTVTYYEDTNGDGVPSPGDLQLTDTDGDGQPDTGAMAAGASMEMFVLYDIPAGSSGHTDATTTASSLLQPLENKSVTDGISTSTDSVEVSRFTAASKEGSVLLEWETFSENSLIGFDLYRGSAEEGPFEKITTELIPATGGALFGVSYSHEDREAAPGETLFYRLHTIHLEGDRNRNYGPVTVRVSSGDQPGRSSASKAPPTTSNEAFTPAPLDQGAEQGGCFVRSLWYRPGSCASLPVRRPATEARGGYCH